MDGWFEEDDPVYGHPRDPYSVALMTDPEKGAAR